MTLDITIPSLAVIAGAATVYFIVKIKGIHLLYFLIYVAGGLFSAAAGYLAFYPFLRVHDTPLRQAQDTALVFVPAVIAFLLWSALYLRLLLQHISLSRLPPRL